MSSFLQDLHHAIRRVRRAPGMVVVAVLSLGLGIGATSSVFSLVDAIVLRPWPIRDPSSLLRVFTYQPGSNDRDFSYPDFLDVREQASAFSGLAAYDRRGGLLRTESGTEEVFVNVVSENYFSVLGVRAELGRTDFADPSGREVVISHDLWQRRFGSDPEIIGRTIRLSRADVTVAGVAPRHFRGLDATLACAVWIPRATWSSMGSAREFLDRSSHHYLVIGRLSGDATLQSAASQLGVVGARLAAAYPETNTATVYAAVNEEQDRLGRLETLLVLTFCIASLVLLICCANVAGLLIVQAEARRREMALRLSLGASRGRLFRMLVGESVLLGLLGAAVGLLLTAWLIHLLPGLMPPGPFDIDARIEMRVVFVTLAASLAATFVAGFAPSRGASRTDVYPVLKGADTAVSRRRFRLSLRDVLVVGQVTLSFVLLAIAAVLLRGFIDALRIDPGFDTSRRLVLVELAPGFLPGPERRLTVHDDLAARLASVPNVRRVSYARRFLLSGSGGGASVKIVVPGTMAPTGGDTWNVKFNGIGPGYLAAVGTRLLRGRDLAATDRADAQPVMLISEAMARQFWPTDDPLGRSLNVNGTDRFIVGIVQDAAINSLKEPPEPYVYLPYAQAPSGDSTLIVETAGDPAAMMPVVRQTIARTEPDLPIVAVLTLRDQMATAVYDQKMPAALAGALGALGMFLAAVGLYGAVAYTVSRRAHDIGLRMALGATRARVLAMVIGHGMRLVGIGMVAGAGLALTVTGLLGREVVGIGGLDALSLGGPALTVAIVTFLACFLPARRAARMSPLGALRAE
jgi:putative ABC transport system permease protein